MEFNAAHPEVDMKHLEKCPVHVYAAQINTPCRDTLAGIDYCPICGQAICKKCGNHNVTQLSRVTGYIQAIQGFNNAKRQEVKDRRKYNIGLNGTSSNVMR
jgi:altronate dehydratase